MKNYAAWLKTAAIVQFLAAIIHAITLFIILPPNNETEKQLYQLMDTYRFDLGAGFHRTMNELTFALSACFCLLCLLAGLVNWYLLRKKAEPEITAGIITINLLVFGILLLLTILFAFLLPILQSVLIVLSLLMARMRIAKSVSKPVLT